MRSSPNAASCCARSKNYKLPHALRMTIGTEEANRLVVDGLRDFMAGGVDVIREIQVNASPQFKRLALIGFGLIGGSIARAAKAQGLVGEIVTTARSEKTRARVKELGIVDAVVETNAEAVQGADLVILCIPVGACGPVAQEIGAQLAPGAIISDVGSVKGAVVRDMAPHLPANIHFVPAHPVAGTEHSGPDSGFAELFINRWCILTPPEGTDPARDRKTARVLGRARRQGRDHDAGPS